jgi:hypothetical protein
MKRIWIILPKIIAEKNNGCRMIDGSKCSSLFQTLPRTLETQVLASFYREFSALENDCLCFSNKFFLSPHKISKMNTYWIVQLQQSKNEKILIKGFAETSNMLQNSSQNSLSFNICSKILKEIIASKFLFAGRMTSLLSFNST